MAEETWVVLRQHIMNPSLVCMDAGSVALLAIETELQSRGIESGFDPWRPGEGVQWTRSLDQPFRLMVKASDLARAEEVAAALESELAQPVDDDFAWDDSEIEPD